MADTAMLYPLLALIGWTFVMWAWLYATRIPAIQKADVDVDELSRTGAPLVLPPEVARVADNYNHLHEQPTLFYALVLCAASAGAVDSLQLALAWGYVGIRVVHSLIQAIRNPIFIRFLIFALASVVLFVLFLRTAYLIL
jgi:hypothetical protein